MSLLVMATIGVRLLRVVALLLGLRLLVLPIVMRIGMVVVFLVLLLVLAVTV